VEADVEALAVQEEGGWEAGVVDVDLALEIEQGGDLEFVGW